MKTGELTGSRVSDVSVSGFTIRGFKIAGEGAFVIDVDGARNTTLWETVSQAMSLAGSALAGA